MTGRTRGSALVATAAGVGLLTWLVLRVAQGRGGTLPAVPWLVCLVLVLLAVVVGGLGWTVRQFQKGRRPTLDPLRAARTVVLAKAASRAGSVLAGWYGGQSVLALADLAYGDAGERAASAGGAAGGAVVLVVAGLLAEHWCRIPPLDEDEERRRRDAAPGPSAA